MCANPSRHFRAPAPETAGGAHALLRHSRLSSWAAEPWDDFIAEDMTLHRLEVRPATQTLLVTLHHFQDRREPSWWQIEFAEVRAYDATRLGGWSGSHNPGRIDTTSVEGDIYQLGSDDLTFNVVAPTATVRRIQAPTPGAGSTGTRMPLQANRGGQWYVPGWLHTGIWDCRLRSVCYDVLTGTLEVALTEESRDSDRPSSSEWTFTVDSVATLALTSRDPDAAPEPHYVTMGYVDGPAVFLYHPALSLTAIQGDRREPEQS